LGIKQLTHDPWDEIPEKYKPGIRVTGTVTNVTDFGLFLELEEGIEGLIHVSEIPASDKRGNPLSQFQVDDVIQAKVINVSREEKKIGLSIRRLEEETEKDPVKNYLNNQSEVTSNLGDLLREEMLNLQQQTLSEIEASEEVLATDTQSESPDSSCEEALPAKDTDTFGTELSEQVAHESEPDSQAETSESSSDELLSAETGDPDRIENE